MGIEVGLSSESPEMVYFADMSKIKEGRTQVAYNHCVMFQDDILEKVAQYRRGKCGPKEVEDSMNDWIRKYTIRFNPLKIESRSRKGRYLLARAPIKVLMNP